MFLGEKLIIPWGHTNEVFDETKNVERILKFGRLFYLSFEILNIKTFFIKGMPWVTLEKTTPLVTFFSLLDRYLTKMSNE